MGERNPRITPISIGYVTRADATDPRSWSGTIYHMAKAFEAGGARIDHIGPLKVDALRFDKWKNQLRRRLGFQTLKPLRSWRAARVFAQQISDHLAQVRPDILYSPAGSVVTAALETDLPVAYSSDATLHLIRNYYARYAGLTAESLTELEEMEQAAISRADLLIYPTDWAASSAISHYGADAEKVHVVPYGANLSAPDRQSALSQRPPGPVQLLFVGVEWERKGGDIAIAALHALNARGIDAEMTVIGCVPPERVARDRLKIIPFLDKNDPDQRRTLSGHYLSSDLFLLPTRQECYGIVFCEAAAHGVPSITTATGGVPGVVREGITGHLLPADADGAAYADAIEAALAAPGGLDALRVRARDDYEARLNWESWATQSLSLMQDVARRFAGEGSG